MKTLISFFGTIVFCALSIFACLVAFINNVHQMDTKKALDTAILSTAKSLFLYEEIKEADFENIFRERYMLALDSSYEQVEYEIKELDMTKKQAHVSVCNEYSSFAGAKAKVEAERVVKLEEVKE